MVYGDFRDLLRRTASDKIFNIAKNTKYDGYQHGLASMVYKFFDKKSSGANTWVSVVIRANKSTFESEVMPKQQLAE